MLLGQFDPLGDDLDIELTGEVENGAEHAGLTGVGVDAGDQGRVELDGVDVEVAKRQQVSMPSRRSCRARRGPRAIGGVRRGASPPTRDQS